MNTAESTSYKLAPANEPPLNGDYFLEIPASNQTASKLADFRRIAQDDFGITDIIFLAE